MRELSTDEIEEVACAGWHKSLISAGGTLVGGVGGVVVAAGKIATGALAASAMPAVLGVVGIAAGGYLIYSSVQEYRQDQMQLLQTCGL